MLRINDLRTGLKRLNGWRQSDDTSSIMLIPALLESESGIYFQQAHALMTLQNLKAIAPDFSNITHAQYDDNFEYRPGNKCTYSSRIWNNKVACSHINPLDETGADYWEEYDEFSMWLDGKVSDSTIKTITRFLNDKMAVGANKNLLENKVLFDGAGRISDADLTTQGIVGFEIIPNRSRSVTISIKRIGLQFTAPGEIEIFIMHTSCKEYVRKLNLSYTGNGTMQWFDAQNVTLPYISSSNDAGGSWFICYEISTLADGVRPISKSRDWSAVPCTTCEGNGLLLLSRYAEVHPFKVNDINSEMMWDIAYNMYTQFNNYGINLDMGVECDMTDFILTQRKSFANLIALQFANDMLREMCYNPNMRINRNSALAQRSEILFALDGDMSAMRKSGLSYELDLAYRSLNVDTAGVDRVCLPNKNNGLKYRTV